MRAFAWHKNVLLQVYSLQKRCQSQSPIFVQN
uniref:Uncharacterized protein n=1 Tax=Ascaris lumbricoides TaxID=6252 RepID=A0A0M3HME7_ASCLU